MKSRKLIIRFLESAAIFILLFFIFIPASIFPQDTKEVQEFADNSILSSAQERNIFADLGYSVLGVTVSNVFLNYMNRLSDHPYGQTTWETIWEGLINPRFKWESGDRFIVNQLGHPYQGSTYFTSARISGFNFYESILFAPFGSYMWETVMEPVSFSINDFITTAIGGVFLGEMLHKLFLEANASQYAAIRAGGFLISPMGVLNNLYHRPNRESGGGNIYRLSYRTGIDKTFAFFPGYKDAEKSWDYPGGYIDMNVVYGNPFIQESKIPYNHFELYAAVSSNIEVFQIAVISDGYLFSYNPVNTERSVASTGLSLHFDYFDASNNIIGNLGHGNIQFTSNAVGWTVKDKYFLSEKAHLEFQAHAAALIWGNSMYNAVTKTDAPWGDYFTMENTRLTFGVGECVKLGFSFFHNSAGRLDFKANGYHLMAIPVDQNHSTGNIIFIYSSLNYEFPLGTILGIGFKTAFWGLLGMYDEAETVRRGLLSNCLYLRFSI